MWQSQTSPWLINTLSQTAYRRSGSDSGFVPWAFGEQACAQQWYVADRFASLRLTLRRLIPQSLLRHEVGRCRAERNPE